MIDTKNASNTDELFFLVLAHSFQKTYKQMNRVKTKKSNGLKFGIYEKIF